MRVFVTGGTGFIGRELVRRLAERGEDVIALVRDPRRAEVLSEHGAELVQGDLADVYVMRAVMERSDAVVHAAARYEVGLPAKLRPEMYAANVDGTENVMRSALETGVGRVVYVSTAAALGNTEGAIVDETHEHKGRYTSYYDETKHLAHLTAKSLIAEGLPCVIAQPAAVYGPGDHSQLGLVLRMFAKGRLPALPFPDLGVSLVHRDDVVDGLLLALDKARTGESYVLGGEITTMRGMLATAAEVLGRRPPRLTVPTAAIRAIAPLSPVFGPLLGFPKNLREAIASADGVTFWARDDKARAELGYHPRDLATGLRDMFDAEQLARA